MWTDWVGPAVALAFLLLVIYKIFRANPEHLRFDTEQVNRGYYKQKKPRQF